MRKVKYAVGASLDGYIASPDGSVAWLERVASRAKGEDYGMGEFFKGIDTVLMGRKTYDIAVQMGVKGGYPNNKTYVFSRSLPPGERDGVEFVSTDPGELVRHLRNEPGKDIWLCGGGELARELLKADALDEIVVGIAPVLIGEGRPTFPPGYPETDLDLTECKQYPGGLVSLTYKVVGEPSVAKGRPVRSGRARGTAKQAPGDARQ